MGAASFIISGKGTTAQEAFDLLVKSAQHERGHGGYTGTIAEKDSFIMLEYPEHGSEKFLRLSVSELLKELPEIRDKWGPAGCIDCGNGEFLFFGWASE